MTEKRGYSTNKGVLLSFVLAVIIWFPVVFVPDHSLAIYFFLVSLKSSTTFLPYLTNHVLTQYCWNILPSKHVKAYTR